MLVGVVMFGKTGAMFLGLFISVLGSNMPNQILHGVPLPVRLQRATTRATCTSASVGFSSCSNGSSAFLTS